MRKDNADVVKKQVEHLGELMYPGSAEQRQKRQEIMENVLRSESSKQYKFKGILGES